MYHRNMKEELQNGNKLFGLSCMYPASGIIEGMCRGWDFVWIDGQHGEHTNQSLYYCIQASRAEGIHSILRVASHDPGLLSFAADMAPSALMIPMINSPEEAKRVVEALRFPPLGIRSYGGRTPIDLYGREYYCKSQPLIIAQIETIQAIEHVDEIAAIMGIDGLFFGPDDMKLSMGIKIDTPLLDNAKLTEGIEIVGNAARANGKFSGIVATSTPDRAFCAEKGYQIVVVGGDSSFIRALSAQKLMELKEDGSIADGMELYR